MAAPRQQLGVSEHVPAGSADGDEADKHDHTTYCWTNRNKVHGNNKCGTCHAFTVICKGTVKHCKWCLALVAYEDDASLCQACCDEDDELADFVQRLQQVDTETPTFYRSMTLPGPLRKYRQWTPIARFRWNVVLQSTLTQTRRWPLVPHSRPWWHQTCSGG